MPGPQPKHPSVRARVNKSSTRATLVERDPRDIEIPELPKRYTAETYDKFGRVLAKKRLIPWHPQTLAWWKDIWPSPMAAEWHESDKHGLFRLADLIDNYWRATSLADKLKAAPEIRLTAAPYGLTPIDRRKLEWTIEGADKAVAEGEQRRKAQSVAPCVPNAEDDLRLRVV